VKEDERLDNIFDTQKSRASSQLLGYVLINPSKEGE
jgi:hypothetical protein